jgi:2-methylcitrate dehydratase PrpD
MEACLEIRARSCFEESAIDRVTAWVPPLVQHLVGRAFKPEMDINYARLCARFTAARVLLAGGLHLGDFAPEIYRDPATADLAQRIDILVRDAGDPNALTPVEVEIVTKDGARLRAALDTVLGNPAKPLTREAHLAKFRSNAAAALKPLPAAAIEQLIDAADHLETIEDVRVLVDVMAGA